MGEFVEDFASQSCFGLLVFEFPVFQDCSKTTFPTIHGGLSLPAVVGQATTMISNLLLPLLAANTANPANRFVSLDRRLARVAMLFAMINGRGAFLRGGI